MMINRQNPTSLNQTRGWQDLAIIRVLAFTYFGTAQLAYLSLGLRVETSPVWSPAGIALAVVLFADTCLVRSRTRGFLVSPCRSGIMGDRLQFSRW